MKWLKKVYGLFVEDPKLAVMALASLVVATLIGATGLHQLAGLILFVLIAGSILVSVERN